MAESQKYYLEMVNRADGTILHDHDQESPISRKAIGSKIEVSGAVPRHYIVRDNYVNAADQYSDYPHRQTLIVDPA
jgi:hypothetical protein